MEGQSIGGTTPGNRDSPILATSNRMSHVELIGAIARARLCALQARRSEGRDDLESSG